MAPTTKPKVRKRKPRVRKKNRGIRTREGHARPADAGSPVQPLAEVLNETKKRRKPKKTWTGLIPVSDDPLEKVSLNCISIQEQSAKHVARTLLSKCPCQMATF